MTLLTVLIFTVILVIYFIAPMEIQIAKGPDRDARAPTERYRGSDREI
jgi:hypothetical protein